LVNSMWMVSRMGVHVCLKYVILLDVAHECV